MMLMQYKEVHLSAPTLQEYDHAPAVFVPPSPLVMVGGLVDASPEAQVGCYSPLANQP